MRASLILIALTAVILSGCGDVRESLGLGRSSPDEFAVVDRPPLSMPPDYGLRPPQPGAPRPQDVSVSQHASDSLFANGSDPSKPGAAAAGTNGDVSPGEQALLTETGATKADPNIRAIVDRETSEKVVGSRHLVDELLFWKKGDEKPAAVVDAPAEAERLKAEKDSNQPLNAGNATPVIERDKSGWLGL